MSADADLLAHRIRPAAGTAAGALVLLHGRATSEHDLFPLLDVLDPQRRLVGITPRGPLSLPPGGSHWYVIRQVGYPEPQTFHATLAQLCDWLDAVCEAYQIDPRRLVLGGFSQGAVMSYATALSARGVRPAALIALSGFIPTAEGFEPELGRLKDLPVAIGHGTLDPVIEVEWARRAKETADQAGARVLYREAELAHTVDPAFLHELVDWVERAIKAAA